MEGEGGEIKSKQASKRDRTLRRCFTFLGDDQDEGPQTTSNGEQKENGNKNGDPNGSKSSDFKGHLNGLYNGLANIMTTTCDLGPDSRSQVAPFAVEKAVHNIMFIKHHMKRQDEFDAVSMVPFLNLRRLKMYFTDSLKKMKTKISFKNICKTTNFWWFRCHE